MQKYPYYVVTSLSGGQLIKKLNGKKFNTLEEAQEAVFKWAMNHKMLFESEQCFILKYDYEYNSNVVSMYDNGELILNIEH